MDKKETQINEKRLLRLVKQGDHVAFEELVETYRQRLYFSIYQLLGDEDESRDISQEAFVRFYKTMDRFDLQRPFYPYLYRIGRNLAIDYIKKHGTHRKVSLDGLVEVRQRNFSESEGLHQQPVDVREKMHNEQLSAHLREALTQLKPEQRDIIMMKHLQEMTYDQIAEVLDIPSGTVMSRLFHARKELAKLMEVHRI